MFISYLIVIVVHREEQRRTEKNRKEQRRTENNREEQRRTEKNREKQRRTEKNIFHVNYTHLILKFLLIILVILLDIT